MRRFVVAFIVLLASSAAWAAAPPTLRDSLPEGAVARLGHARMVADPNHCLEVSPDGKWVRAALSSQGAEADAGARWFRIADGREATPPANVPKGYDLRRVHPDGSFLVGREGRYLVFAAKESRYPRASLESSEELVYFDRAGRYCVKRGPGHDEELFAGSLTGDAPFAWRYIATAKKGAYGLRLSARGGHVAWAEEDGRIRVCDLDTGKVKVLRIKKGPEEAFSFLAISADGKGVACHCGERVQILGAATGKVIRDEPVGPLNNDGVAFTADGKTLVLRAGSDELRVVPVAAAERAVIVKLAGVNYMAQFGLFPDGKRVAVTDSAGVLRIHDLRSGEQLDTHSRYPGFAGVRLIGTHTAVSWTEAGRMVTWDVRTGRPLAEASVDAAPDFSPECFDPGGGRVAGCVGDQYVIAETRTGKVISRFGADDSSRTTIDFHPSGKALWAVVTADDVIRLKLFAPSGVRSSPQSYEAPGNSGVHRVSPDGRFVLYAMEEKALLIETATGKLRWRAELGSKRQPTYVAYDRKGKTVIVVDQDGANVFDLLTGKKLTCIAEHNADQYAASGSGRWLVLGGEGETIRLWDLHSKYPAHPVLECKLKASAIKALDLDEDATRLVTAHEDGTCLVWDLEAMRERKGPTTDSEAWERLGERDPAAAVPAMEELIGNPGRAVRLLAKKLVAVPKVPRGRIDASIARLDSDDVGRRNTAQAELVAILDQAEGRVREAAPRATPEARLRLGRLIRLLDNRGEDPAWLRWTRSVEVLERIGTPEAVAVLEKLSGGDPAAAPTREVCEALGRLR